MNGTAAAPSWQPAAGRAVQRLRADAYRAIRAFFDARGVLEVETPILSRAANPDPNLESLTLAGRGTGWYLRTSPEFAMKRLVSAGSGPVYELGRVFRAGEQGRWHNHEFTMLEWYRPGFDPLRLADEVVDLVRALCRALDRAPPAVRRARAGDLVAAVAPELAGLDQDTEELLAVVRRRGWFEGELSRRDALELVVSCAAELSCGSDELLVVFDYPAPCAALARVADGVARRFEVHVGGREIANGYDELRDPRELADRLHADNRVRRERGLEPVPVDHHLLAAHEAGLPQTSGVALGVDRLLCWLADAQGLGDVLAFPADRA